MTIAQRLDEAEQNPVLSSADLEARETALRTTLLVQQYELLKRQDRAILFVIAGVDGSGKGSAVQMLNEWMDPRHIHTQAFGDPWPEEAARPHAWRYWRGLPARGRIGLVFGSWYTDLLREAAKRHPDEEALARGMAQARAFELQLRADEVHVVKLWFHLSRDAQRDRCERLAGDPDTAWRVSEQDRKVAERYPRLRKAADTVLAQTDLPAAPWIVIPSADDNARALATATAVLQALEHPLPPAPAVELAPLSAQALPALTVDPGTPGMSKADYQSGLTGALNRLGRAVRRPAARTRSLVVAFEGMDAAGKGGAIRRVVQALDVRDYDIVPIAAPSDEERAHPYLWRFWRHAPLPGRTVIFDRSWYGRVLVERVEKLTPRPDWQRAYDEINTFEAQWVERGAVLVKFWLEISPDEQLARFQAREQTPFKSFKITEDDWRNRDKHDAYREASREMLARTDTAAAPWHVIATDDKRAARVQVVQTLAAAMEQATGKD